MGIAQQCEALPRRVPGTCRRRALSLRGRARACRRRRSRRRAGRCGCVTTAVVGHRRRSKGCVVTNGNGTDNLVSITINGRDVRSEKGRLLIDVAEELGVFVPRFCYHPGMKSVAVCRMCLVKVEGMPKLAPACATPVAEGMNVNTLDSEAVEAQEGMLEFLLINHP